MVAAIQTLRKHRRAWGIPSLPEAGIMAVAPGCHRSGAATTESAEHENIHNALFNVDVGAGPRYGTVCDEDTNRVARGDGHAAGDWRYETAPG